MATKKSSIYSGGGRLYFKKLKADGSYDPIMYFGKTDGITLTSSVEFKEHFDTEGCTPLLDAKYPSKKSMDVKFSTSEITLAMQNMAFLGNVITKTQTIATDEPVVVAGDLVKLGSIVDCGYYNTTVLIVKDDTDNTTYVDGLDYSFDAKSGFITIMANGSIVDGAELHLTITAPAITFDVSATMKQSSLLGEFTVVTSSQTGNNFKYIFKMLSVTQDGDFTLKGEEIGTLSFTGAAMIDTTTASGVMSDFLDIIELDSSEC